MMHMIFAWMSHNKTWFFSGIGVLLLSCLSKTIIALVFGKKKHNLKQTQRSGDDSINVQAVNNTIVLNQKEGKKGG